MIFLLWVNEYLLWAVLYFCILLLARPMIWWSMGLDGSSLVLLAKMQKQDP